MRRIWNILPAGITLALVGLVFGPKFDAHSQAMVLLSGEHQMSKEVYQDTIHENRNIRGVKGEEQEDIHKKKRKHSSRITDEVLMLLVEGMPKRPRPLLEFGDPFLNTGPIKQGVKLPTGAVWQPSFVAWGTYRTALQSFDSDDERVSEWANRLDLFGNLYLSFTERIVIGFRPLDYQGRFTGYTFSAPDSLLKGGNGWEEEFNLKLQTLFFEGDFGELFPFLDKRDKRGLDFGFAVGRQQMNYQDGMLINDNIDAFGVSKINMKPPGMVNLRTALIWGWNELNRNSLPQQDKSSSLFGWFNEIDWRKSTVAFDVIYVNANNLNGDGIYVGFSTIQRIGNFNSTFRILGSRPLGEETDHNKAGALLFSQISWTARSSDNYVYISGYLGVSNFRSASRDPTAGGPLGSAGILYAASGLGRSNEPLYSSADDVWGGAVGYQIFSQNKRKQLQLELGGRYTTEDLDPSTLGAGARFQLAFGRRGIIRLDGYTTYGKEGSLAESNRLEFAAGGRFEVLVKL